MTVRIELARDMLHRDERLIAETDGISVSGFRYASGIEAIRVKNRRGELIILPFKGQQIWSAAFDGRDLTMKSMFPEPVDTDQYLETYGAFLIHCGITAMGPPGPEDTHPLHGELPNAPFQTAFAEFDEAAGTVTVGGTFTHTVSFTSNYCATTRVTLGVDAAMMDVSVAVDNLMSTPLELMYLAHANFRPVDNGELIYTAPYTAKAVRVRQSIPSHITPKPGYRELIQQLAVDPTPHHVLKPELAFDPEIVFAVDMEADEKGWAHALQRHPDGTADYISYRPDQAAKANRWICRMPDQEGLGMAFPSTSGVEGKTIEKANGSIVRVDGKSQWRIDMKMGALTGDETADIARHIDAVMGRG